MAGLQSRAGGQCYRDDSLRSQRRNRQRLRAVGESSSALTLAALTNFGVNSGKTDS